MNSNRLSAVLAVAFALVAADSFAQRGSLRGRIVGEDGSPIEGVECTVELSEGGRSSSAETKEDGQFVRGGLRPGMYTISCEKEGYRQLALSTTVSGFDQANLGERTMYALQPGELTEAEHARATELLEQFNMSSESGNDEKMLASLKELDGMMPDSPEVQFNIASTYERMKDVDNALVYYTKTTELKPDFYEAWLAIGDIHGKRQEWAEAQVAMKKAIDLKATDAVAIFNYAVYAQNAGDGDAAKAGYELVLAADPNRALAHYQLGLIAVGAQENEAALAHFEKFLELAPDHEQAEAAKGVIEALKQESGGGSL